MTASYTKGADPAGGGMAGRAVTGWICTACGERNEPRWPECLRCGAADLVAQLRGMIWWLAAELATGDVGQVRHADTWVATAERFWNVGQRHEARPLVPLSE